LFRGEVTGFVSLDPDGTTQTSSSDATRDVKIADHDGRCKLEKKVHGLWLGVAAMAAEIQLERSRRVAMAGSIRHNPRSIQADGL
jgi:hypothetical protein